MFQTFSGSSRRPRQVNLSGQNKNPFAASPQKAVANAQQERQLRQLERDRLNASKRIQKVWRGHKVRQDLADSRRKTWDELEVADRGNVPSTSCPRPLEQLQLLLAFFSPHRRDDIERLAILSQKMTSVDCESFLTGQDVQQIARLGTITLEALQVYVNPPIFTLCW